MNQPEVYISPLSPETPSHLPPHPTPLGAQSTGFGLPASYSKFPLAIHTYTYVNVYVSMLRSQITPPSPFPTVFKSLCLLCCPAKRIISVIFLDSTYYALIITDVFLFLTHFTV